MLEIKHVTKVYKTKGGVDTKALDDVSISFGETGLVFLLGKSGSGKSTLLNVCGGLDEPTSGEIIVKGKSSKDFSGSDFDSYRNTFVGFIFQEYNVLDEFNVEDNIALALELQGKPKDKQKIAGLLQEVELGAFAKRKPNTLSGGQKQRIAIARALIKEPQIIMADEPTGALDSATGKQVFDTLKQLSKTRLVIVVSHDREFAEVYGDRIVELKDGKIISDVSKSEVPPDALDENLTVIGGSTLSIKNGSKLTKKNIKTIQDFVLSSEGDVIITKGEKQITSFKKANRMTESGATETFNDTDTQSLELKEYSKDDSKFIRSRLPAGKAIKIGASGLKLKPVRLVFTILLSFIAFTMFGLFSTLMLYDGDKVTVNSYAQSDYDYFNLTKRYTYTVHEGDMTYTNSEDLKFTDAELKGFTEKYGSSSFGYYSGRYNVCEVENVKVKSGKSEYYNNDVSKFAYLPAGHKLLGGLVGTYPKNPDEVCVSSYFVDVLLNSDVYEVTFDNEGKPSYGEQKLTINSAQDVLGKYMAISLGGNRMPFKVTGVFQSGEISAKYDKLKDSAGDDGTNWILRYQFSSYIAEGIFKLALVSENFYETYEKYGVFDGGATKYVHYFDQCNNSLEGSLYGGYFNYAGEWIENDSADTVWLGRYVKEYGGDNKLKSHFFGGTDKTRLSDYELVLGTDQLDGLLFYKQVMGYFIDLVNKGDSGEAAATLYSQFMNDVQTYREGAYYVEGHYGDDGQWIDDDYFSATPSQRTAALERIVNVTDNIKPFELDILIDGRKVTATIVGFHECDIYDDNNDSAMGFYASKYFIDECLDVRTQETVIETNYVFEEGQIYSGLYVAYDKSESAITNMLGTVGVGNKMSTDVFYILNSSLYQSIETVNDMAETLSTVFLWVGIVFAAFSALLMFNFISVSISSKRKEIGILRAVGARGTDVFKIFFSEAGIISAICTVLAVIGSFIGCALLNNILKTEIGMDVTLFVFGIASVGIMVAIALLVAFVSTFLPVYFAARKKPVESIRAL